ncbi:MAG: UDP-3-O-(3-hydroxymyristoyl)glucosamine N-acyltransferase [Thiomicrospira sp.]|nr:MAG: UDP-3-O-(3-hydroxymyristoyl)glucosamine N-acyltransferase [Thiomicrospira sp.]
MKLKNIVNYLKEAGIDVELKGDDSINVDQVSGLVEAQPNHISFLSDSKRLHELEATSAGVVLINPKFESLTTATRLLVDNPYFAFAKVSQLLNPESFLAGIHASAVVDDSAKVAESAWIGENVVIGKRVTIEDHCFIGPGSVVLDGSVIGQKTRLVANVTVMHDCIIGKEVYLDPGCVIGGQGFGFANEQGEWHKIPQIGRVVIGDRVFVGVNANIHRGAINDTVIESNCIIDSLVHIAHNVSIGYGSAIASQVGFAGSTTVGKYCVFAGQAGINGHISITDKSYFAAKSGVTHTIKEPGSYSGFPAIPTPEWQKNMVRSKGLNKMAQKIKHLEKELQELKSKLEND